MNKKKLYTFCGIYGLRSISNPDRIYVGSSVDVYDRWLHHRRQLIHNVHHAVKLQRHVMKYGIDDIELIALAVCPKEQLVEYEQIYINTLRPYFNSNLRADRPPDTIGLVPWNKGLHWSEEAKQKMSASHMGKGCGPRDLSPETLEKLRENGRKTKGRKLSEEHKQKLVAANTGRICSEETKKKIKEGTARYIALHGTRKHTEETKKKIGAASKGNKHSLGRVMGPEERARRSESAKGKNTWTKGVKRSDEVRRRQSERLKINHPFKGKHHTPETIEKIKETKRKRRLEQESQR